MGFSRKRLGRDGKARYTAYYKDIKGRERSANTFSNKKDADRAWQKAEAKLAEGRVGDPARGRIIFERYVEDIWLPNHVREPSTREGYTYSLRKHIIPEFGPMRMIDILPEHVRGWITQLSANGVTPATIKHNKMILSAIFTTALNDQVTFVHPCKGVKTPTVPVKPRVIITPEQFDMIYQTLPDSETQLLVETDIESGLRWGELTELRVSDLDCTSRVLTVSRAVVQVNASFIRRETVLGAAVPQRQGIPALQAQCPDRREVETPPGHPRPWTGRASVRHTRRRSQAADSSRCPQPRRAWIH